MIGLGLFSNRTFLLVMGLVLGLVGVIALLRRRRHQGTQPYSDSASEKSNPRKSREPRSYASNEYEAAINRTYRQFLTMLDEVGVELDDASTLRDDLEHIRGHLPGEIPAIEALFDVYHRAFFSPVPVGFTMRERAHQALLDVREELAAKETILKASQPSPMDEAIPSTRMTPEVSTTEGFEVVPQEASRGPRVTA